jgi:hypothetical protein
MPKRTRSLTSPLSPSRCAKRACLSTSPRTPHYPKAYVPLTHERLTFHNTLAENQPITTSMSTSMPPPSSTTGVASSRSASPSKSSEPKVRDNEDKLRFYGIHLGHHRALPVDLEDFVNELQAGAGPSPDTVRSAPCSAAKASPAPCGTRGDRSAQGRTIVRGRR